MFLNTNRSSDQLQKVILKIWSHSELSSGCNPAKNCWTSSRMKEMIRGERLWMMLQYGRCVNMCRQIQWGRVALKGTTCWPLSKPSIIHSCMHGAAGCRTGDRELRMCRCSNGLLMQQYLQHKEKKQKLCRYIRKETCFGLRLVKKCWNLLCPSGVGLLRCQGWTLQWYTVSEDPCRLYLSE